MKRILKIGAIVFAVIVVLSIAIPFFLDVNSFRPKLEATATGALGRQVKVGNLSLSILLGTVTATTYRSRMTRPSRPHRL